MASSTSPLSRQFGYTRDDRCITRTRRIIVDAG